MSYDTECEEMLDATLAASREKHDSGLTVSDIAERLRVVLAPFPEDARVEWYFGNRYALEHVSITLWAESGNHWSEVEVIPYLGSVQEFPWSDGDAGTEGIPAEILAAMHSVAGIVSTDVPQALLALADVLPITYYESSFDSCSAIKGQARLNEARSESAEFLDHLKPAAATSNALDDAEVEDLRVAALGLLEELINIDPADLLPSFDEAQLGTVKAFWALMTPTATTTSRYEAAFDSLERFRAARQEVCS